MGCQGDLARRRRQGLREALRRTGELAAERDCKAVTIGGDLYEHERAGVDTARFLAETFAAWRPLRVFIAPGNHDPLMPGSVYRRTEWPDNVVIFDEPSLRPCRLEDGLTLWGLGHREPSWQGDPLECPAAGQGVHLALFHGAELGSRPEDKSMHGPFMAERVRDRGYQAALVGHYHRRRIDESHGVVYPGSPEPLSFDETGAHGPVLVEVGSNGTVRYEALTSNRWSAVSLVCDVSGCGSSEDVIDALCRVVSGNPDTHGDRALVRMDLQGGLEACITLDLATLESVARERTGCALLKVRDLTTAEADLEAALRERGTRGAFARATVAALDRAEDPVEQETLTDALRYGLAALAGAEVGLR